MPAINSVTCAGSISREKGCKPPETTRWQMRHQLAFGTVFQYLATLAWGSLFDNSKVR